MANKNFLGLRSLIYAVNDIEKAKQWYTEVLGEGPYFDEAFYVGFNVGGFELGLTPTDAKPQAGNAHGYWGVEDVDQQYQRLLSLGATSHEAIQDVGGGIRLGTVVDPFGNILGVIYNPAFNIE